MRGQPGSFQERIPKQPKNGPDNIAGDYSQNGFHRAMPTISRLLSHERQARGGPELSLKRHPGAVHNKSATTAVTAECRHRCPLRLLPKSQLLNGSSSGAGSVPHNHIFGTSPRAAHNIGGPKLFLRLHYSPSQQPARAIPLPVLLPTRVIPRASLWLLSSECNAGIHSRLRCL